MVEEELLNQQSFNHLFTAEKTRIEQCQSANIVYTVSVSTSLNDLVEHESSVTMLNNIVDNIEQR